jgi:cell division transport system ATP-binding protein
LLEILALTIVRVDKGIEQLRQIYDFLQFLPSKILLSGMFGAPALRRDSQNSCPGNYVSILFLFNLTLFLRSRPHDIQGFSPDFHKLSAGRRWFPELHPADAMGDLMIRFENVTKIYPGQERPALDSVNLEIVKGEFVFLVGLSGSGKSTFLRLVLREERPTSGAIHVAGKDLGTLSKHKVPELRRSVGTVFQDFRLLPNKTISENVAFTLHVLGYSQKEINREVPEVLELVGLEDKGDRLPSEISGGEQQRVAIARAYVSRPPILIADEPTGNLDPATSVGIMKLLDRINREGTTVLMATHDAGIVDQMRKRVIELDGGHVIRDQVRGVYGYTG